MNSAWGKYIYNYTYIRHKFVKIYRVDRIWDKMMRLDMKLDIRMLDRPIIKK